MQGYVPSLPCSYQTVSDKELASGLETKLLLAGSRNVTFSILHVCHISSFHLHAAHENNLLEVKVENHALSVWCVFLSAFQGVAFCEITLGKDPTFAYPKISPQRSLKTATAGENVSITGVGTLNANTTYYYNVSAVLDDNMTTRVVVQGFITTPPGELCIYSR